MDDEMDPALDTTPAALRLAPELLKVICDELPNRDVKQVRLTCRTWARSVVPRTPRVFISANPRNIEVFNAIATHESFRHQVKELIWDDATLYDDLDKFKFCRDHADYWEDLSSGDKNLNLYYGDLLEFGGDWTGKVPAWFREACMFTVMSFKECIKGQADRPDLIARAQQLSCHMPITEAWAYYAELLEQQRQVLASKAHIRAFEKHIGSFPALKRITITPATYGTPFNPLYETPMIRSFPRGFIGPLPRGWRKDYSALMRPILWKWEDQESGIEGTEWQGVRTVARVLSEGGDGGRVTDLRIDAHRLETGLNMMVFDKDYHETFKHFKALLARPGLKHLHLDLMVSGDDREARVFGRGLLRRALKNAAAGEGLEHLHIGTDTRPPSACHPLPGTYVTLSALCNSSPFTRLRHFSLSRFHVTQSDLVRFLGALPRTLRSVELSMIEFVRDGGNLGLFLDEMRDHSNWPARDPRPTLRIGSRDPLHAHWGAIRQVWVDDDVTKFLYESGPNPFQEPGGQLTCGYGTVEDVFDADFKQPN